MLRCSRQESMKSKYSTPTARIGDWGQCHTNDPRGFFYFFHINELLYKNTKGHKITTVSHIRNLRLGICTFTCISVWGDFQPISGTGFAYSETMQLTVYGLWFLLQRPENRHNPDTTLSYSRLIRLCISIIVKPTRWMNRHKAYTGIYISQNNEDYFREIYNTKDN